MLTKKDAIFGVCVGVCRGGLGLILYTIGSKTVPAAELTLLSLCEVLLAPLWVWLFLGESASKLTFIGGFILLIAITFNSLISIMKRKKI